MLDLVSLHKKWSFSLRISSVNVSKDFFSFLRIWSHLLKNLNGKLHFLCIVFCLRVINQVGKIFLNKSIYDIVPLSHHDPRFLFIRNIKKFVIIFCFCFCFVIIFTIRTQRKFLKYWSIVPIIKLNHSFKPSCCILLMLFLKIFKDFSHLYWHFAWSRTTKVLQEGKGNCNIII